MKHTIDDVKLTIATEFRMLHNRVGVLGGSTSRNLFCENHG